MGPATAARDAPRQPGRQGGGRQWWRRAAAHLPPWGERRAWADNREQLRELEQELEQALWGEEELERQRDAQQQPESDIGEERRCQ